MKKTFIYSNELTDDFGSTVEKIVPLPEDYKYSDGNVFFRFLSSFLYRIVARPLVYIYVKVKFSHKFANKSVLKGLKTGYMVYSNHTTMMGDAYVPNLLSIKKRNYIITGAEANSLTGILWLMKCVGNLPLGQNTAQQVKLMRYMKKKLSEGHSITVFPEAHIWPYYTGIRPFGERSFGYAVSAGVPAVAITTCFRKRRFRKTPGITTFVDGPFYPDPTLSKSENSKMLRDKVYSAMTKRAKENSTYSYHTYIRKDNIDEKNAERECELSVAK